MRKISSAEKSMKKRAPPERQPKSCRKSLARKTSGIHIRRLIHGVHEFLHPAVVNAQEFVAAGGHVNMVGLALGPFFVQELKHRVVGWGFLQQYGHKYKERLAQFWRASL